ncbi:MAG: response regulator [Syntrophotaleaceae bacterium]
MNDRKRFGEILLEMGVIREVDLEMALARQKVSKKPLGLVFEELGVICEKDILRILARQFNLKKVEGIGRPPVPEDTLKLVDVDMALTNLLLPLGVSDGKLLVATSNPLDFTAMDKLAFRTGLQVVPFLATPTEITRAIRKYYLKETAEGDCSLPALLVVDDQPPYRATLCNQLQREGYRVRQAEDGAAALKQVLSCPPQLILLETGLRGMNGKDVFRTLQTNSLTRKIPVIALSSRAYAEEEANLLDMGFFDFIAKPYNLVRLLARVRRALAHSAALSVAK